MIWSVRSGCPNGRIQSSERLTIGNWSLSHRGNYFSDGEDTDKQRQDGGLDSDDLAFIGSFQTHSFSLSYEAEKWRAFLTVENAFDAKPDLIDSDAFVDSNTNNMPLGVYPAEAITGRTVILSFSTSIY